MNQPICTSRMKQIAAAFVITILLIPSMSGAAVALGDWYAPDQGQPSRVQSIFVLYDGMLNTGTPATQGFVYLTNPLVGAHATQTFTQPVTILDTTPQIGDYAGYFAKQAEYPPLDRMSGYQVLFTVQVLTETHISADRAGFSVLVISRDLRGIELGFWRNEVWAQEGGAAPQLFTHAEGAAFDTTGDLIPYRLTIKGEHYHLAANGTTILSGPLRDYTTATVPLPINPYTTPNLIFLGDDTGGAQAKIGIAFASVSAPIYSLYLPLTARTEAH